MKEFSAASGLKIRAAQGHRERRSAQWLAFLASKGYGEADQPSQVVVSDGLSVLMPPPGKFDHLAFEDRIVAHHQRLWLEAADRSAQAFERGQHALGAQLAKTAKEQAGAYEVAVRIRDKKLLADREVVPIREWEAALDLIRRLAELIQHQSREVADACNPGAPEVAERALRNWRELRWNPAIEAVEAGL